LSAFAAPAGWSTFGNTIPKAEVVPADAVEARLAFVFVQPNNQAGAVHIDDI
jgi:hypothetical protein